MSFYNFYKLILFLYSYFTFNNNRVFIEYNRNFAKIKNSKLRQYHVVDRF